MTRPASELAHLFRALKAPAAARALPKLADRARADEWSFEQFAAALLKTEVDSRDSHGGQGRIKVPARKTLEEFDFSFQTSSAATPCCTSASSTSSPAARTSSSWARPILVHTALLAAVIGQSVQACLRIPES
jgi:DNA replication protein DnaC